MRRATSLTMTTDRTITPWVMTTTDGGMSTRCSDGPARSRKANSSAAAAIPPGELRPNNATAMPENPSPATKLMPYAWSSPRTCGIPTRPASAPDSSMACMVIRPAGMPLAAAAVALRPDARSANPKRVRLIRTATMMPTTTATKMNPPTSRLGGCSPKVANGRNPGNHADSGSGRVDGLAFLGRAGSCSGPRNR